MTGEFVLDEDLIRRLAELLEETGLDEIELAEDARRIRVARNTGRFALPAAPEAAPKPAGPAPAQEASADANHPGAVVSPMVGTLYVAPGPQERPFVTEGGLIAEGETMFIIEAMKTMNPVRAPRAGTVTRILAANNTPVEYGQVLAVIE